MLKEVKYGPHVENAYKLICEYWKSSADLGVQALCVKAFAFLFSAYPGILLRCESVLKQVLSNSSDDKLRIQALYGLSDFMDEEDERAVAANLAKSLPGSSDTVTKLSLADSGASTMIPQHYLGAVCSLLLSPSHVMLGAAFGLLKRLLNRGLVIFSKAVPYLIAVHLIHYGSPLAADAFALLLDGSADIQAIGLKVGDAVRLISTSSTTPVAVRTTPTSGHESVLGRVWAIVREQKQPRNNFLFGLTKIIEAALVEKVTAGAHAAGTFVAAALAAIPFQKEDEVMLLISHLNRLISSHLISDVLMSVKNPTADRPLLQRCEVAIKVFQLKAFLKSFYHISHAKLAAFTGREAASKTPSCSTKSSIHVADLEAPFKIADLPDTWETTKNIKHHGRAMYKALKGLFDFDEQETNSLEVFATKRTRKRKEVPIGEGAQPDTPETPRGKLRKIDNDAASTEKQVGDQMEV